MRKNEQSQRGLWDTIKHTNIGTIKNLYGEGREKGEERIFKDRMPEEFWEYSKVGRARNLSPYLYNNYTGIICFT